MTSAKAHSNLRWIAAMLLALALSLLLSACGFKLKQAHNLPFNTLYTNVAENSAFGAHLRRILTANSPNLRLVSTPEQAEVQLLELENVRNLRELSLDPNGHVEDYELQLRIVFTLLDNKTNTLLAPTTLSASQEVPNNPDATYAKHLEINSLFESMELRLVDRLARHLSSPDVTQAYERSLLQDNKPLPTIQPPASATSF